MTATKTLPLHVRPTASGTLVMSPDYPELYLIDSDREAVFDDLLTAIVDLWLENEGQVVRASVIPEGEERPITAGLARLADGIGHQLRLEVIRDAERQSTS